MSTWKMFNLTVGLVNYKCDVKISRGVTLLRVTPGVIWTWPIYIYIYIYICPIRCGSNRVAATAAVRFNSSWPFRLLAPHLTTVQTFGSASTDGELSPAWPAVGGRGRGGLGQQGRGADRRPATGSLSLAVGRVITSIYIYTKIFKWECVLTKLHAKHISGRPISLQKVGTARFQSDRGEICPFRLFEGWSDDQICVSHGVWWEHILTWNFFCVYIH